MLTVLSIRLGLEEVCGFARTRDRGRWMESPEEAAGCFESERGWPFEVVEDPELNFRWQIFKWRMTLFELAACERRLYQ